MIVDGHEEIINWNGGLQCYCRHAEDLSFLSSVHFAQKVSIDLENFLHSQQCVSVPTVVHGDKETREFSKLLINWLRGYRFGLDIEFVQEFIEQLPGVEACSGYILCKDRLRDSSSTISNKKIKIKDVEPFPVGSLISSRLSSNATGDLLQVYEFLCRFKEVLEVEEDFLSYKDLENELHLTSWPVTYGYGAGAFLETVEMNCVKHKVDKLTTVHMALLPWLVSKLLRKITKAFKVTGDAKDTEKDKDKKVNLEMFPINPLTWPEVARRYILACLLTGSKKTAVGSKTKLIRCLQGDDAIFSGSPAGVAGSDVDAQLLGRAVEKVFGKRKRERSIFPSGTKVDNLENYRLETDFSIPEWAKVLDPVRKLPTNVGSRIRNCVHESLKKNPPEWAKKLLEASISKDVYKGNASGPTKRAVIDVLQRVSDGPQTASPPGMGIEDIKTSKMLSNTVMKKCRVVLRQVAEAYDKKEKVLVDKKKKVLFDLVGRDLNCNDNYLKIVFGSVSMRPIDLRTIDLRLFHGAYGASHEAFLEDVKEVWINLRRKFKLVDKMSCDFKLRYEKEVGTLFRRFYEDNMNRKPIEEIEKELEEILTSTEIPKAPWETGICNVCGINKDDGKVLICDRCEAYYHTYCLTPPLSQIPKGNWFCPICVPPQQDNEAGLENILQFVDKNCEENIKLLDIATALKEKEYWELDADKKTFLLKFLCDELLKTSLIRTNVKEPVVNVMQQKHSLNETSTNLKEPDVNHEELSLRNEFLGIDSDNRFYWVFQNTNTSTHHGIVVNDTGMCDSDSRAWCLFQSDEQIKSLINYLKRNDPSRRELRNSISKWQKSITKHGQQTGANFVKGETVFSHNNGLATKASELLEAKYNTDPDSVKKPRRKNMAKWHRCECLEPVLPCRYHCVKCHETFFTNVEFEQHKKNKCDCGVDLGLLNRPGPGRLSLGCDPLRWLKMNLLDMEAALPDEAKRGSRASSELRSEWCAFVKSANTVYEMVEATMVLETMIKTDYINNTWWWYWSSMAAAAKTSTISALALRIYTLDAAIDYQKTNTTTAATSSSQKLSKKRKHPDDKPNE
uniref:PHD-type domain-containing protein n=3 Tax=Lactuca sativa TaxID=4236 RepID=A0A9R1VR76_LACSA|nr:hypothetical protein LSAT_V11C400226410 [Lactuca sativa]